MGKAQLEQLEKEGNYYSVPRGISMWPMIRNKKDVVEIQKLEGLAKRYDLVMYVRGENRQGVHKGKWHEVTELGYRIYVHLWTDLFFIRRPVLYLRDLAKKVLRKLGVRRSK